nr:EOG090X08P9 [Triops cancriformis]
MVFKWINTLKVRTGLGQRNNYSNTIRYRTQWTQDYKLVPWGTEALFGEYLEMVLQYGFVTIFVAAFPLAPLFALLNNVLEMRLDARKILTLHRRPVAQRVRDIGIWYSILDGLGKLAVVTNGFIIAFTSDFIPRLVYTIRHSPDGTLAGYLNHSLAAFNTSDFPEQSRPVIHLSQDVQICYYQDFRNPPGHSVPYKKLFSLGAVALGGTAVFASVCTIKGNEKFYSNILMPLVHKCLDPEQAHNAAVWTSKNRLFRPETVEYTSLRTKLLGLEFPNCVGMAAGFDKHAEAFEGLFDVGFGFVEVGSVTPEPQSGNPRPRVFRLLEDHAIINRYGFNSEGHDVVHNRVKLRRGRELQGILGVNLGKNKTSEDARVDYVKGVEKFGDVADYLVINVSSPNTPGLRLLQNAKELKSLILSVMQARNSSTSSKPPVLLKIAPDLPEEDKRDIAQIACSKECRVDGLIVTNTTISRPLTLQSSCKSEVGGLSGEPLKDLSTHTIRDMYRLTNGEIPIIGVGGVSSGADAYEKVRAGASLVQLYTAFAFYGPPVVEKIKKELAELLRRDGFSSVAEAVGVDVRNI